MDCASGHDRPAAGHHPGCSPGRPYARALSLASGRELRFVDPRRFGRLEFRDLRRDPGFSAPGAEPLTIGPEEFAALFRGRRLAIKAALLNQTLLAGVGNIYADESLFRAGIRPRRRSGRLTRAELERLRLALRQVLEHAIRLGGSSVSDYVDADGVRGFFQLEHCVYLRTGLPCRAARRRSGALCGRTGNPLLPEVPAVGNAFYGFLNYSPSALPECQTIPPASGSQSY
jgi:DNA-formamidopyrimidine glycosylase